MESNSCSRCVGWNTSPRKVLEFLRAQWAVCESCDDRLIMRAVIEQFQLRQTRWWVVNGVVAVPIWIVEYLKMHPELWTLTDIQPSMAAQDEVAGSACQ